jgi:hypothetical protein
VFEEKFTDRAMAPFRQVKTGGAIKVRACP